MSVLRMMSSTELSSIPLNLYFSLPPVTSSVPSTSCAGSTTNSTKLSAYHANVPSAASTVINPVKPGHPVSLASVSCACSQGVWVDKAGGVNSLLGLVSDGAGQPVTSLQRKANA